MQQGKREKVNVLFVCAGNTCRSPMAEFIMKKEIEERGIAASFEVASAGTSDEEEGNPVYPPAAAELQRHALSCAGKRARALQRGDFAAYDLFVCMDRGNLRAVSRLFGSKEKQALLLSCAGRDEDVADPWYSRRFDVAYRDIFEGVRFPPPRPPPRAARAVCRA